jgi:exodeoxyribonuclease V alpha subunit
VAEHQAAEDERLIVAWLRAAKQGHEWPEVKALDISNHQREQLVGTLQGRIGILTGSPGTGKTYALARVVAACADKHGFESVSVCAPTGKAAVRITQAMSLYGVNVQATTIHSLLGVEKRSDDGDWGFRHNHANPLPCQYVCVDEPSMIDTSLMASLLDACGPATHVLFAGDPNQLPPVGRGKPMLDMIHAGLPCGSLREIHRNSGLIVEACAAIRDGGSIKFCDRLDPDNGRNLKLIRAEGAADVCAAIRNVIAWMRELPGFQPIYDCQFLVALNKSGPLSRLILNRTLRPLLNPRGQEIASNFHMGDKVICLRNGFYRVKEYGCNQQERTNREIYVANGDQGVVWGGDAAGLKVAMSFRREVIWVPISQAGDDGTDDQDGEENGSAKRWTHADTITCHKSQGSEWPLTVTVLDGSYGASRVTSRNWLTTAISRGQRAEILIGSQSTIGSMRGRDAISGRKTFLTELIQGG